MASSGASRSIEMRPSASFSVSSPSSSSPSASQPSSSSSCGPPSSARESARLLRTSRAMPGSSSSISIASLPLRCREALVRFSTPPPPPASAPTMAPPPLMRSLESAEPAALRTISLAEVSSSAMRPKAGLIASSGSPPPPALARAPLTAWHAHEKKSCTSMSVSCMSFGERSETLVPPTCAPPRAPRAAAHRSAKKLGWLSTKSSMWRGRLASSSSSARTRTRSLAAEGGAVVVTPRSTRSLET